MNERLVFNSEGELLENVCPLSLPDSKPDSFSGFQVEWTSDSAARVLGLQKKPDAFQLNLLGTFVRGEWQPAARPARAVVSETTPKVSLDEQGRVLRPSPSSREPEGQPAFSQVPDIRTEVLAKIRATLSPLTSQPS